jgi:MarR family 2-MHQ and catechol resistance regulon transcriptional repressor
MLPLTRSDAFTNPQGPLPVNTIGPIVDLTPGSISIAVDRLVAKGLVSRVENAEDRRVRIVALTLRGKDLITGAFRKHSLQMKKVFSEMSPEELRGLASHPAVNATVGKKL